MTSGPSLRSLLLDAHLGLFPPVDGGWTRIPLWRDDVEAVVAFTGHAFLAVDEATPDAALNMLGIDGFGGAHAPHVIRTLAGEDGWIDSLDVVLVVSPDRTVPTSLVDRPDLADHPRVRLASQLRDEVRVLGRPEQGNASLVTVARGLGGLTELGIETDGRTDPLALIREAAAQASTGEPVIAAVAPGNARALRAFLRAGFVPVASVQLFQRAH